MGHGGLQAIHELTGISKTTIIKGKHELKNDCKNDDGRIRKNGGGRKAITQKYKNSTEAIEQIIENSTVGNPERIVLWTTKGLRILALEFEQKKSQIFLYSAGHCYYKYLQRNINYLHMHNAGISAMFLKLKPATMTCFPNRVR